MFGQLTYLKNIYNAPVCKIYLCVKLHDKMECFSLNYNCIKFDTYKEADEYYKEKFENNVRVDSSTLMPVCKYIPEYFHPLILNYKLSKLFIDAHIIPK